MNDFEKLNKLAQWFDLYDKKRGIEYSDVQHDLRRISKDYAALAERAKRYSAALKEISDFDDCDCDACMPCIARIALEQREGE